jgi:hypothetical protein
MEGWKTFIQKQRIKKMIYLPNEMNTFLMNLHIEKIEKDYPLELVTLLTFYIEYEYRSILITRWGVYSPKEKIEYYHWYIEEKENKEKVEHYFSLNMMQLEVLNHLMIEYYEKGVN